MKAILPTLLCVGILNSAWTGCSNPGLALREPVSDFEQSKIRTSERFKNRQHYVDNHYKLNLKSGRAKNEEEARAMAGLEWERFRHRSDTQTTQTTTWSSREAEKQKQKQLESELAQMDLE